jgi:hypothetical protein
LSRHYSREELDRAEIETIKKYSTNHFAGFNSESGGKKNFTYNKETLERMRNSRVGERNGRYGKPVSEETRRKIGQANRGYRSAWKGKKHTEDELKRIGKVRYENIRRNVAYAVVNLMAKFVIGYCSQKAHKNHWNNEFSDNNYDPEYANLKPGSFLSEISNQVLNDYTSITPIGDVVRLDDPKAKKCILDSLVKGLVKYKNQPKGESTRYRTSIYGILNKFDINEEILKEICKAY